MFNAHLKKLTASLSSSFWIIRATTHTSLDWCRSTLKMAYHALIHSKLNCAAPAWQSWVSATNLSCLDRLQNYSPQLITGQLVSTPLEALHLKADIQSYHTCCNQLTLKAQEKALRSTNDHPKRFALTVKIPQPFKIAAAFIVMPSIFILLCQLNLSTAKPSTIFHLHHGNEGPPARNKFPPLFLVLLVRLMTFI